MTMTVPAPADPMVGYEVEPYEVVPDVYVIPQLVDAPPLGMFNLNSLVIRGEEPIVVDTGTPAYRDVWLRHVSEVVDLEDVRWIFLTHDDRDHSGNLVQALEACPNATLLSTWFQIGRMTEEWMVPMDRVRFVNDGDSFEAGNRTLLAVQPPLFDNPTTRGLFDSKSGVYWSVDTFAAVVPHEAHDVRDLDREYWLQSMLDINRLNSPWHQWLDAERWARHVNRAQGLPIKAIASCHAPAIRDQRSIDDAFDLIRRLPGMETWPVPTQQDLEMWMSQTMASVGVDD